MEGSSHSHSRSRSYSHHSRSHSRAHHFSGGAGPTAYSGGKKPPLFPSFGGNAAFFTTSYDDVFGGPPTYAALAPRAEDYSEIFGAFRSSAASRASSIPVLDLPAVADIDASASFLDYSEVFGGFDAVDFAVPYDELFRPFDAGDCSSDEAWTPVGSESPSDDSDPFAFSEKSPYFSDGNSHQSLDDKQFNVSYHKVNPGTSTSVPNMTHVAELNAVPGYTCVVDESMSLGDMSKERFCSVIDDDIILSVDSSSVVSEKQTTQIMSHMLRDDVVLKSSNCSRRSGRARSASASNVNLTYTSVSDVNLGLESSHLPPPFRPPPVPAERKGDFSRLKPDSKGPENSGLETTVDASIPFFEMEIDASSSAAVSAAAMSDAMEKAQAKLKSAKVSMDRKRGSLQNGENLGLKADVNIGERVQMIYDRCTSKDDRMQAATHREVVRSEYSSEDTHARSAPQILLNCSDVEQHTGVTEKLSERKNRKKHSSFVDAAFTGGAGEWKEATQYYEFINGDMATLDSEWPSNSDAKTSAPKQQDIDDKNNSYSADEACVPQENRRRLKVTKAVSRQAYYEKMVKVAQEVHSTMIGGHVKSEKGLGEVPLGNLKQQKGELEKNERQAQQDGKSHGSTNVEEGEIRSKNAAEKEGTKQKGKESCGSKHIDRNRDGPHQSIFLEVSESKDGARRMQGSYELGDCEGRTYDSILREEHEQRAEEARERAKEKKLAGTPKPKKDNWSSELKSCTSKEASDDGFSRLVLQPACESQENNKIKELQPSNMEDNRKKDACENVDGAKRQQKTCQSHQRRVEDERSKEVLEDIFSGSESMWTDELEETRNAPGNPGDRDRENTLHRSQVKSDPVDGEQIPNNFVETGLSGKDEHMKLPNDIEYDENGFEPGNITVELNKPQMESDDSVEVPAQQDNGRTSTLDKESKLVSVETAQVRTYERLMKSTAKVGWCDYENQGTDAPDTLHTRDNDSLGGVCTETLNHEMKKVANSVSDSKFVNGDDKNKRTVQAAHTFHTKDSSTLGGVCTERLNHENEKFKPSVSDPRLVNDDDKIERTVHAQDNLHTTESDTPGGLCIETQNHENKKIASSVSDPKLANASKIEQEEKKSVLEEGQVPCDEKLRVTPAEGNNGWNEQSKKKEAGHTARPERRESILNKSEPSGASQSTERRKIITEEKNKEKERDLLEEQLRKLEEEKEREREREKDRMAVEIAIREARERAYADARDRAERADLEKATDEARHRAMAEARERLEKACAEARERSLADKASEARMRAERAAVERATAEARQRAIEKAKAERVSLEAWERMQRSVSEKYSYEREPVTRQSSMTCISERFEAADGEPAERCKARLERHRRTVERVAKALAEKNMRDLLAQREQTERNRLAETLDADIKRWSSGKEGNLRALISTLQYILGPDCGWQPIPLTEVITAAAVKKAYRKATLYVHPDKLQQRGASIQQKYVCEKVFDLLKEAWNRFNSEEK